MSEPSLGDVRDQLVAIYQDPIRGKHVKANEIADRLDATSYEVMVHLQEAADRGWLSRWNNGGGCTGAHTWTINADVTSAEVTADA